MQGERDVRGDRENADEEEKRRKKKKKKKKKKKQGEEGGGRWLAVMEAVVLVGGT